VIQPVALVSITKRTMKKIPAAVILFSLTILAGAQPASPDLARVSDPAVWRLHNRSAKLIADAGRQAVQLDGRDGDGVAWLVGSNFSEGTIEFDVRGKDVLQQSFVGLAFRGVDDVNYDAVYFRPFNFKNADTARRARAVQYISQPKFPWEKLRADTPGKYEQPVSPVPDPNGWFHARIVLENHQVSVFVDGAATPCLVVAELSERRNGMLGLWVGNGSAGDFANLKIIPRSAAK
jgi:hypothetical protein